MVDTRFSVSLQIMMTLAAHQEEGLMNSEFLARVMKTNPTFVRKLTARLVDGKLVESFRGKNGGIRLARTPRDIGLDEIYAVATAEKPLMPCATRPVAKNCKVSCSMERVFEGISGGIETATRTYLARQTLADVLKIALT